MSSHKKDHHQGLPRTDEAKAELRGKGRNPDRAATRGEAIEFSSSELGVGEEVGMRGQTTPKQGRAADEARYRPPSPEGGEDVSGSNR